MKTYETNKDFFDAFLQTCSRPFIGEEFSIPIACVNDMHGEYVDVVFSDEFGHKITLDKKFTQALEGFLLSFVRVYKRFSFRVIEKNSVEIIYDSVVVSFRRIPAFKENEFVDSIRFITQKGNFSFVVFESTLVALWEISYCFRI